jgi:hypothetical protein
MADRASGRLLVHGEAGSRFLLESSCFRDEPCEFFHPFDCRHNSFEGRVSGSSCAYEGTSLL